jgi:hypothetical protein
MPSASIVLVSHIITTKTCHGARDYLFQRFMHESATADNVGVGDSIQMFITNYTLHSKKEILTTFHCMITGICGRSLTHVSFTLKLTSTTHPHTLCVPIALARLSYFQRALGSLYLLPRRCLGALHTTRTSEQVTKSNISRTIRAAKDRKQ